MKINHKNKRDKKRICILSLIGRGGTYNCASIIASNLAKHTDTAILIPTYSRTDLITSDVKINKTYAPTSFLKTFISTFNIIQHTRNIRTINKFKPDTIIFADIHPWYRLYWNFLKTKNKISILHDVEIHQGESSKPVVTVLRGITNFLIKKSDKIIVLSQGQKDLLKQKISDKKIILSKHGHFDFYTKYSNKKTRTEPKTILFYGRIKEYKGLKYLLDALKVLYDESIDFKLIIAGEGDIRPYNESIEKLKEKIEIHNTYVSDEKTAEYFQRASFVVLPYTEATQTGIIPIAYSFKKTAIVTDTGSLPEVVVNGKTGIVVRPRDTKELSKAIKKLLQDTKKSKVMGLNGYKYIKKELDWEKIVRKLVQELFP